MEVLTLAVQLYSECSSLFTNVLFLHLNTFLNIKFVMVDLAACIMCTHEHVLDFFSLSRSRSAGYVSHLQSHEIEPLNFGKCLRL